MIKKIFIALITIIVLIAIMEAGARIFHVSDKFRNEHCPSHYNYINSLKFRDVEHSKIKPPGTYRVVVLGDSFVYAKAVPFDDMFPRLIERKLNESSQFPEFEVINCARPGWNTAHEIFYFGKVFRDYKPDMVLISYVLNDTECTQKTNPLMIEYNKKVNFREPKSKISQYLFIHSELFNYIYSIIENTRIAKEWIAGKEDFYKEANICFQEFKKAVLHLRKIMKHDNFKVVVVIFPYFQFPLNNYPFHDIHKKVTTLFNESGFNVLDLFDTYKDYNIKELKACHADAHPNIKAHHLAADTIVTYLQNGMIGE
ncbi:MAG: hypothetical protein A2Y62_08170 [Candidatus Fischerbacteria bacterium RBG_13_37_8]|uniref:SGNH hydrolase-type esterase domain-containing protein n=1 Tax=Candidatus Fischerbacteria bacterium RBG_13_37_8 TaxID=1817863 RepID=A0A1F5V8C4_9BACT|nr:MAG: hypothetical protein A2Y62_08170 [Candidatus Fischerbacteria bacterium RBG_13_37_8]